MACLLVSSADGATYYVNSATGDDSRDTTQAQSASTPWDTMIKARQNAAAGDIIRVTGGPYAQLELFSTNSGTANNWINWVGNATGTGVVVRNFTAQTGASYNRFTGFEVTHEDTAIRGAVRFFGACHHLEFIDCYFHDVDQEIAHAAGGSSPSYITFRNVNGYYAGHPGALQEGNSFISLSAAGDPLVTASHFLVEYCHVERVVDFGNLYGTNHIVRNNWSHDMRDEYWTAVGHPDFAQPGSEQTQNGARHHVYERNFVGDSPTEHSHFGIWQDYQIDYGDTNHLIRGNVGYQIGGGGIGNIGTDKWQTYHNTFHEINGQNNGHVISWARDLSQNAGSVGGVAINSIIADDGIATDGNAIFVENDNFVRLTNNWGYLAGSEPSYLGTTDPKFVDPSNQDFRLQSDSPVINLGTYVTTITTADGSGTTFDVADSHIFYDGWGRVEGDLITTGGTTVRITGMTNLTVFVSASVSWTNGQPIYWGTDTTPDLGAYPYGIAFLTSATMLRSGTTYTVTPVGDARGVWFYVDGIPTTWDYEAPFQTTVASGTVTAKAYALYAQTWPVVNATDLGESGSSPYRNKGRASRAGGVIP